jgi:hypothetical protein
LTLEWKDRPAEPATEWEIPDLCEGSKWYKTRIHSLCQAIQGLPNQDQLIEDGIQALARHRLNYTCEGSQQLQLLWWEFPEEHWEPLREGCSMNFLIMPSGELQMDSPMDEAGRITAGKFVDELVKLGVLLPANGRLRANCSLFCVDKTSQPGEKRCIADCKKGGQNACMGQDPTYLVRNNEILPQLYAGGWSAIADASKQFHNFPTKPDEHRYLGCIHPITGSELVHAVSLWGLLILRPLPAESTTVLFDNCDWSPLGFTERFARILGDPSWPESLMALVWGTAVC